MRPMHGKGSEFLLLLICPERQRWKEELLRNKRPHVNDEMSLKDIFTVYNVTEQGNLGALAYNVK